MAIRNWLFDKDILPSTIFDIPVIAIGNLAVGGTGKTPHTEFIIRALQKEHKIAVLSRGYKRKTKGFYLADEKSNAQTIGDEPYQIFKKFKNITVAVDEKRVHGVNELLKRFPDLDLILLDDAYQHRYIQPGMSVLLTDFNRLYCRDALMPVGRLREPKNGRKRADIIVVTKCPADVKPIDLRLIESEIKPEPNQELYFSGFTYDELVPVFPDFATENWTYQKIEKTKANIVFVAGIVSPEPAIEHLQKYSDVVKPLIFEDHHAFQLKDYTLIKRMIENLDVENKILVVTEKDAARMVSSSIFPEFLKSRTFAMPIRIEILHDQEDLFIQKIQNYVIENSRNS